MYCKSILHYCCVFSILFTFSCLTPEQPVTKEEAAGIAIELGKAVEGRNPSIFNDLLDYKIIGARIKEASGNKLPQSAISGAVEKMKTGVFLKQIIQSLGEEGTYKLVKQYEKDNRQHLIFRLYNEQINYHDFELVKTNNKVKIADFFVYATGENITATLAQTILSLLEDQAAGNSLDKKESKKLKQIKQYLSENKHAEANQLLMSLPASVRAQKIFKIVKIQIASGLSNDEYIAAMTSYQQEYPDATNIYLIMIDAYYLKKDYAAALRCINKVDSMINKDPFLDYYRAAVSLEDGKQNEKIMYLERLQKNMPEFGEGTKLLLSSYIESKQMEKAVALGETYRKRKDADTSYLETLSLLYPDFEME